jgi:hypothetical protein
MRAWFPIVSPLVPLHSSAALAQSCKMQGGILMDRVSDPYRTERHYMRGPGPKHRAKAMAPKGGGSVGICRTVIRPWRRWLVGSFAEPGVGITQACRCDLVAKSCPLTIPLLLINRRHLNAQDGCAPAKSSSPLRQPQHLARSSNADSQRALPFCMTFRIAAVWLQVTARGPLAVPVGELETTARWPLAL